MFICVLVCERKYPGFLHFTVVYKIFILGMSLTQYNHIDILNILFGIIQIKRCAKVHNKVFYVILLCVWLFYREIICLLVVIVYKMVIYDFKGNVKQKLAEAKYRT